ncbi:MAG TPA: Hsp20/alpha crystallin family protein [Syntrophobacteraceae bacterium]|nr:Hsp20/alpha crystallin family protein [Syntrophobacteraceae bacterium]
MTELSTHRRERAMGNVPVSLNWADRLFNELMPSRIFRELIPSMLREQGDYEWMPAFDIAEADDHFLVKADLPGIDPNRLDIALTGNVLTIRGEKKQEHQEKNEHYYTIERQFGSFNRSFMLPADVKEEGIEAAYRDGVLRVTIPKSDHAKQRKIHVKMN